MSMERNLFDLMQDFVPPEELLADDSRKEEVERIKLSVYRKKGAGFMRRKVMKRLAVASLALVLATCGAVGVDAATGGHVIKMVKKTLTIENPDGTETKLEGVEIKKNKDGSFLIDVDGDAALPDGELYEDNGVKIKKEGKGEISTEITEDALKK